MAICGRIAIASADGNQKLPLIVVFSHLPRHPPFDRATSLCDERNFSIIPINRNSPSASAALR